MKSSRFYPLIILSILFLSCNFEHLWPENREIKPKPYDKNHISHKYPFQNPKLPVVKRVKDLVLRLTLEEKINQMNYNAPAVERLGIPAYNWWNECLHGVARAGYATVFPQSITLAASWDKDLMVKVATIISDEARAKHHEFIRRGKRGIYQGLTFWSPNINIFRDPRWGRGHETYGEDPYLTGQMGLQFVKGLQGDHPNYLKVVATAKHFAVHSGPEYLRHSFDVDVSEIDLLETYLPAFRTLVKEGQVASIMGAYNRFRGQSCCANSILEGILRHQWGFKGYIVSDCWAIHDIWQYHKIVKDAAEAAALAVKRGTDLNCGTAYPFLKQASQKGLITEAELDRAVERLFLARFKLGMFDPPKMVPYTQIPFSINNCPAHQQMARIAARKSIVLLKNQKGILPLHRKIKTIAVIGPHADEVESLLGNYNGIPGNPITVLDGIKTKVSPATKVLYAQGSDLARGIPILKPIPSSFFQTLDGKPGIYGEYFANSQLQGEPVFSRVDDNINFYWESGSPAHSLEEDNFSIRWTGYILTPVAGEYHIGCWSMPKARILLDGEEIIKFHSRHHAFHKSIPVRMKAKHRYKVVFEYSNNGGDADVKLLWSIPKNNFIEEAVNAAQQSDVVLLVLGLNQRLEGEEMSIKVEGFDRGDRTNLKLPQAQRQLMKAIKKTGKPTILVLLNGGPLAINWAVEHIDAILTAGYAGEQGGNAIADVLFGYYNPGGRLPVTYYKSVDQLPPFTEYDMKDRTYRYFRGKPLFPFGFGLSYTTFTYKDLEVPLTIKMGDSVPISLTVTNKGSLDGEEVVQLYLTDDKATTTRPLRQLAGFERIFLKEGESQQVNFILSPRQLSLINKKGIRVIEPGTFTITVGGKQPGFSGYADSACTHFLKAKFKVTGNAQTIQ
jgi:beta-glucosidase